MRAGRPVAVATCHPRSSSVTAAVSSPPRLRPRFLLALTGGCACACGCAAPQVGLRALVGVVGAAGAAAFSVPLSCSASVSLCTFLFDLLKLGPPLDEAAAAGAAAGAGAGAFFFFF